MGRHTERRWHTPAPRRRRLALALALLAFPALLAGCASATKPEDPAVEAQRRMAVVQGLPQVGNTLGSARARATGQLFVRVDDINNYLTRDVLPELVRTEVRPGRMKLQLRTVPHSRTNSKDLRDLPARVTQSAGLVEGRTWDFFLAYAANSNGVSSTASILSAVGAARFDDAAAVLRQARGARVGAALARAGELARDARVELPALVVDDGRGHERTIELAELPSQRTIRRQLDRVLRRR